MAAAPPLSDLKARVTALVAVPVVRLDPLHGGDLSTVIRASLADGRDLIAKLADNAAAEADMLRAIAATGAPAPEVLGVDQDLLLMTALAQDGRLAGTAWDSLAAVLAKLHAEDRGPYGWSADHGFGAVAIANGVYSNWADFWANNRIRCHFPHIPAALVRRLSALADRLGDLLPQSPRAALLHGDLWGGNVLVAGNAVSGLIDPACYRGDREVDIAMLTLFDHPPASFFDALGLAPGWRDRLPVYRLWPLLVHLRLFGNAYAAAVDRELEKPGF